MNDVDRKLAAARTRLILDKPFLGALVLRLPLIEAAGNWCETSATDARSLYYNPSYIEPLNLSQVQFVLAHEALHCGLSHFARRDHRNKNRWNLACDYAVNQLLIEDGLELPPGALLNEEYQGLSAEEIYPLIKKDAEEQTMDQHLYDGQDGQDGQDGRHPPTLSGSDSNENSDRNVATSQPPPLNAHEREKLNTQWQQRLVGAAQQASIAGKMSGSVARMVDRLLRSSVPWRNLLARFMSSTSRADYNLMRPSQRRGGDAILPSLHSQQTNVLIALDTSGSIEQEEIAEFITEINAIKGLVNARITLLACDSELDGDGPWVYESWEHLTLPKTLKGDGGTDFVPVFDWMKLSTIPPDLLIYFTDAKGRFPNQAPNIETLWLVKGSADVPWGQRVQLN